jgi:predicted nuclease with TOPRIM domain
VDGAEIDTEYQARFDQLKQAIADRAKSLNLEYQPDETYQSPEVWANAYRLALYGVSSGVDTVKEHQWLGDQMKQWRDFLKTLDDRKEQLREKAALVKTSTGPKVADLNTKIDDLQQRIDATTAEEAPLKAELQQAQADLDEAQTTEAGLDDKYYKQLDSLPEASITKHISVKTNGRFTWVDDDPFVEGEKEHRYWIFTLATRSDGRQYWALHPFSIRQNKPLEMYIEPGGFISTKAILRPNLSPEEQEQ